MDSTQNFNGIANNYTIGRPAYAKEFIEHLYSQYGFSKDSIIADIGSGTGKFTKQLLDQGSFVYSVEPNDDMRNTAIQELHTYDNFRAVKGTAAETGLPAKSVDFITTAQAFHWFDVPLLKKECKRILKENGSVFLIWNLRDRSCKANQESFELYSKYCPNFKGFGGGIQKDDDRIKQFFDNDYQYMEYAHPLFYDKAKFISRSLSGSYSLKEGDPNYQEYFDALTALFEKHEKNGVLTMENKTVAYFGRLK